MIAARLVRRSVSGQVFRPERYEFFDSHEPLGQTADVSYAVVESHGDQSVVHVQRVLGRYVQTKSRFAGVGEGHHHHVGSVTDVNSLDKQNYSCKRVGLDFWVWNYSQTRLVRKRLYVNVHVGLR